MSIFDTLFGTRKEAEQPPRSGVVGGTEVTTEMTTETPTTLGGTTAAPEMPPQVAEPAVRVDAADGNQSKEGETLLQKYFTRDGIKAIREAAGSNPDLVIAFRALFADSLKEGFGKGAKEAWDTAQPFVTGATDGESTFGERHIENAEAAAQQVQAGEASVATPITTENTGLGGWKIDGPVEEKAEAPAAPETPAGLGAASAPAAEVASPTIGMTTETPAAPTAEVVAPAVDATSTMGGATETPAAPDPLNPNGPGDSTGGTGTGVAV